MDNQRVFLWGSFLFVLYLLYQSWVTDYQQPPAPLPAADNGELRAPGIPAADSAGQTIDDLPAAPGEIETATASETAEPEVLAASRRIRVLTDVFDLEIDTMGGDLRRLDLLRYPLHKNEPNIPVRLLNDAPERQFIIQSGMRAQSGPEPNHRVEFLASADEYVLADGDNELQVVLTWDSGSGLLATKTYTFRRGRYDIQLEQTVANRTGEPWAGAAYVQLRRRHIPVDRSFTSVDSYSYRGPVYYNGKKYEKLDVDDLADEPLQVTASNGWLAAIQHHFLGAAIPEAEREIAYSARMLDNDVYLASAISARAVQVPTDSAQSFRTTLFLGPKLQKQMEEVSDSLVLTVDYGFLTVIAQPLFWVLKKIHGVVGNWGWSIILLTMLIKLAFYKLAETSGRSMAKLRRLQPRMKTLQERYKDDRQALSRAMMEMYKEEGANPMSGCLPILVQMPVFIALYWALIESVELRQAPWALWIQDLSSRDPYFILPVLMGVTMLAQQKLNPAPPDPVQAKVMMVLPIVFTVFFAFFPSGLVLYWFVNNLLSILQQWRINTVVEREYSHKNKR